MKSKIILAIVYLFLSTCFPAFSQGTDTGTLSGTVRDVNGAALPGTTVTVTNTATGSTRNVTANDEGRWVATVLPLGQYDVTFENAGFSPFKQTGVIVAATATTTLSTELIVGEVSDEVIVREDAGSLVSSETATTSRQITSRELESAPLTTRSFTQVLLTETGASSDLSPVSVNGTGNVSPAINGARPTSSSLLFNGIDATNFTNEGSLSENISPAPETIQEVKLLTSLYDASVGRSGGGNIQIVTKQGGNKFNGSAYYYVQNEKFNANDFFYNRDGIDRQKARRNEGGFTIGGPIIKDKFFFFGGFQKTKADTAYVPTAQSLVVLPEAFTLLNNGPRTAESILAAFRAFNRDPVTGISNFNNNIPVPDYIVRLFNLRNPETGDFFIPAARPDAERLFTTASILGGTRTVVVSLTDRGRRNTAFSGNNPLVRQRNVVPARFDQDQFTTRLDYSFNNKNTLAGTFFFANFPAFDPFPESSLISPTTLKRNDRNRTLALTDTHIFTPTLINEVRFGYFYLDNTRSLDEAFQTDEFTNAAFGISNPATFFEDSAATRRLANFTFTGNLDDFSFGAPNDISNRRLQKTTTFADNVTYVRAAQTFRFGVEVKRNAFDTDLPEEQASQFERFESFGQFLGGLAPESDTQFGITDKQFRFGDLSFYATDDFKVNRKLTLNLGVRWDWFGFPTEKNGRISNFDFTRVTDFDDIRPGFILPSNVQPTGFRAIDESVAQIARVDNKHTLNGQDLNNFAPRFGFAYSPFENGRTVIRGGYGVFFDRPSAAFMNTIYSNYPFLREIETVVRNDNEGRLTNAFSQQDPTLPFSSYLPFRLVYFQSGGPQIGVFDNTPVRNNPSGTINGIIDLSTGTNVIGNRAETLEFRAIDRDLKTPYIQQWNLGIQQEFGGNFLVEARYIGTKGTKLLQAVGFNQPYDLNDPNTPDHIFRRINDAYERAYQYGLQNPTFTQAPTTPLRQGVSERERGRGIAYGGFNDALDGVFGNAVINQSTGQAISGAPFDFNIADPGTSFNLLPIDARTPYLGFGNPEAILLQSAANSIYHSAQLSLTKRLSNNFQFNTSYTFSKAIDTISADPGSTASAGRPDIPNAGLVVQGDQRNLRSNRAVADFDRPHRFAGSFIFDIPSFGLQSKFLNGFQLSGFAQAQSGSPFTIFSSEPEIVPITDEAGLALQYLGIIDTRRTGRFDVTSGSPIAINEITLSRAAGGLYRLGFARPSVRSLELLRQRGADPTRQYFNNRQDQTDPQTALLSPLGGFGNLGRNTLRGPNQRRIDLGLTKRTRFSERAELELRWDVFNIFNFTNFANPNTDLQDQTDFGQITRSVGGPRTMQFGAKLRF